jgi:diadenosine tetraphosphate (Ap4A) HIT family hydrolase
MICPFCDPVEVVYRSIIANEHAFALLTHTPIVPGHTMICPKRHVTYYEETTADEKAAIEALRERIKEALRAVFNAEGFNYAWNEEPIGGQTVPHFHLHIVPRIEGDAGIYQYEPREFLYRPGARTALTPHEELMEIAQLIRQQCGGA